MAAAQGPLYEFDKNFRQPQQLPILNGKGSVKNIFLKSTEILVPENDMIPLNIYSNFQCTEICWKGSYGTAEQPRAYMMTTIPESSNLLYDFAMGDADFFTKVLAVVDKWGYIKDTLLCSVSWSAGRAKEYYIDEEFNITISSILPQTCDPVFFFTDDGNNFKPFMGYRQDEIYQIIEDRFVLKRTIIYQEQVYCAEMMAPIKNYHIKDGNEIIKQIL